MTAEADVSALLARHVFVGVAQRISDLLPLMRYTRLGAAYVCEGGPDVAATAAHFGVAVGGTAERDGQRGVWTNESLAALPLPAVPSTVTHAYMYAANPLWEQWRDRASGNVVLHAPSVALKSRLDDKIETRRALAAAGVPVPRWTTALPACLDPDAWRARLGTGNEPLVVQTRRGASGLGTWIINDSRDLSAIARTRSDEVLVSTWVGATTLNVHGLVQADARRVLTSAPSVQLVGTPGLSTHAARYCGNDFGAVRGLPTEDVAAACTLTERVGQWLAGLGYDGLFGVDIALGDHGAFVIDVNPRMQGSTWLLGEVEVREGTIPTALAPVLNALGHVQDPPEIVGAGGAHAVLHWDGSESLDIECRLRPGAYRFLDDHVEYRGPAVGLLECGDDEVLLTGLPPVPRAHVAPGAVVARVATWSQLSDPTGRALTDRGAAMVEAAWDALLTPT